MSNKLEVGMYVRTKNGNICKILRTTYSKYQSKNKEICYEVDIPINTNYELYIEDIDMYHYDLKRLVQVGDYINGFYVEDVKETFVNVATGSNYFQSPTIYEEQIKSIVTKEQFESMSYKVGD